MITTPPSACMRLTAPTRPHSPRANDTPAHLPRRQQGGSHTAPSATATTWPQPARDQVGHTFEWYALLSALSCIGPPIDPGMRMWDDDTSNNDAPSSSVTINRAKQPTHNEEAAIQPSLSDDNAPTPCEQDNVPESICAGDGAAPH